MYKNDKKDYKMLHMFLKFSKTTYYFANKVI